MSVSKVKITAKPIVPAAEELLAMANPEDLLTRPTLKLKIELECTQTFMADLVALLQKHGATVPEPKDN